MTFCLNSIIIKPEEGTEIKNAIILLHDGENTEFGFGSGFNGSVPKSPELDSLDCCSMEFSVVVGAEIKLRKI